MRKYSLIQEGRNVERLDQSPLTLRSSVHLEPYGRGPYRLVNFNYTFRNVGADPIRVSQVVVRRFLHRAISLADKPLAVLAPDLDRGDCLAAHDPWVEYARPATYGMDANTKILVADNAYTAGQGGGLAELAAKTESGGSALSVVKAGDDDFLGFLVCVRYSQGPAGGTKTADIMPWKTAVVFRAKKNLDWTSDGAKE